MKKFMLVFVFIMLVLSLSACFGPKDTQEDQAIVITKSGKIQEVKIGGGRHWSMEPYVEGTTIGLGIRGDTFVTDGENGKAWTKDSQPVIVTIAVEYRIIGTDENIMYLWKNKKGILESDSAKYEAVRTRLLSEVKDVTTQYTLLDIVGIQSGDDQESVNFGRDKFVEDLISELAPELENTGIELVALRLQNIDPADDEYEALLNEAAKAKAREKAAEQNLAVKRKEQESARIDNEIAKERAENNAAILEINAEIWEDDRAFQLELTRLLSLAISSGDVIVFVPEGEDITYLINGNTGNIIPVE